MNRDPNSPNPTGERRNAVRADAESLAPQPPSSNLNSDITDELTDHLSLATRDLQLAGHTADEAQKLAHQRFGDIATIRRRLWWIQKGDQIMLRIAVAAMFVILLVAFTAIGVGGWQMNQTIGELGAALASMNETQRALLESREQEDRPRAIRGRLYLRDKSKPASYASVDVLSLPEGKKVDTLMADEDGRFGTSSLAAGHYTLLASLIPTKAERSPQHVPEFFRIQSRPISIYPWSKDSDIELDVAMLDFGQVSFELTRPFPIHVEATKVNITTKVFPALVIAIPSKLKELPIHDLRAAEHSAWPVIGLQVRSEVERHILDCEGILMGPDGLPPEHMAPLFAGAPILFERVQGSRRGDAIPAGKYTIEAFLTCRLVTSTSGAIVRHRLDIPTGEESAAGLPDESRVTVEVLPGKRTHLRITPPDNLEQSLRAEIEGSLGDTQKYLAVQSKRRPVTVEFADQRDTLDLQELSSRPGGPFGTSQSSQGGFPGGFGGGGFGGGGAF